MRGSSHGFSHPDVIMTWATSLCGEWGFLTYVNLRRLLETVLFDSPTKHNTLNQCRVDVGPAS